MFKKAPQVSTSIAVVLTDYFVSHSIKFFSYEDSRKYRKGT
jgi:hypothetical protein